MPMQNFGVQIRYILGNVKVACKAIIGSTPTPPPPPWGFKWGCVTIVKKILSVGTATKMSET